MSEHFLSRSFVFFFFSNLHQTFFYNDELYTEIACTVFGDSLGPSFLRFQEKIHGT